MSKNHIKEDKNNNTHSIVKLGTCCKPWILLLIVSRLLKDIILDFSLIATPRNHPTTPIALESTSVKHKYMNMFSPIFKALNKNIKVFVDAMACINAMQFEIEKHWKKTHKNHL